ncbi:MAG: TPM domain-containing protein [Sphingobacteriales bacterium]|jgi:uncharacterized protein|nr:TPM domain-containing protein [Sphingobacteriales bacterium]
MTKKIISLFLVSWICLSAFAKEIPAKPNPPRLVNDYVNVLDAGQQEALEAKLKAYSDSTSTQIAIVIEQSLEGDDDFDYSQRLAEGWQIGMAGKNNGLLIYVAIGDRKIRIQNGYGLEATITDAFSRRLIEEVIKPNFKQQAYYEGLDQATTFIIQKASGEFVNDDFGNGSGEDSFIPYLIIISFIILMFFLSSRGGKGGRGLHHGPSPFMGTFGSSGYSGGSSSSFGGFGGGSFGGGGAGGSW